MSLSTLMRLTAWYRILQSKLRRIQVRHIRSTTLCASGQDSGQTRMRIPLQTCEDIICESHTGS
jgi:hypothetical protein